MFRRLLALLVLLTGLAAIAEPARAVETGVENVSVSLASGVSNPAAAAEVRLAAELAFYEANPAPRPLAGLAVPAVTVVLQADRARE